MVGEYVKGENNWTSLVGWGVTAAIAGSLGSLFGLFFGLFWALYRDRLVLQPQFHNFNHSSF